MEIGSDFWLNRFEPIHPTVLDLSVFEIPYQDYALLSSGRQAIAFVLDHINVKRGKKKALLPAFTCESVITPFIRAGYDVGFFMMNKDLSCDIDDLSEKLARSEYDVLLLHGYFGFDTLSSVKPLVEEARKNGVTILKDITQTLYSRYQRVHADFYIASLRKWAPLPDGAIAFWSYGQFRRKPKSGDLALLEAKLQAFHAKYSYMTSGQGDKHTFRELYKNAEALVDNQAAYYAMNELSLRLQANLDVDWLRKTRRMNYITLLDVVRQCKLLEPIFSYLPTGVTPLYFPVYVKCRRDALQDELARQGVYCPIIWPKPAYLSASLPDGTQWIYDHILAIPCDQRYGDVEMRYIGQMLDDIRLNPLT